MQQPIIGQSVARIDASSKVKGEALYPGDINLPNQAILKILFSSRPHAIVEKVDTTRAEKMPRSNRLFLQQRMCLSMNMV